MGNCQSKCDEWSEISERNPENLNERWTRIFRYVCGGLGISSSLLAWYLIYVWLKQPKLGGFSWRDAAKSTQKKTYNNNHIFAMSSAFLLMMAPSVLSFEVLPLERHSNKDLHYYMNVGSLLMSLLGMGIAIDYNNGPFTLKSTHAVVGYGAMALMMGNFLGGFLMYVLGKGGKKRGSLKPLHKRMGLFALLAGMSNILVGLMYKQAYGRYDEKTKKLTHTIAALVLFSMFNIVCSVTKFVDKKDPPQD